MLTDDDKRNLKTEWKEANNKYFTDMKNYLNSLDSGERCFVERKLKMKASGSSFGWTVVYF